MEEAGMQRKRINIMTKTLHSRTVYISMRHPVALIAGVFLASQSNDLSLKRSNHEMQAKASVNHH